ncbi:MAG: lysophospholipid acyltransferase family protein [Balneolaceae bacterium]|nr:lysophospholipid acyltransferase family protein [Balneolaceae bacterium]
MSTTDLRAIDYVRSILGMLVFFIIFLIATPVILALLIISFGRATNLIVEQVAPLMVKPVLWISGIDFSIKLHNDANEIPHPAVYIINHSSTVDLLTILALGLPRARFVAKWELQYNPIFFLLGHITGQVFIKRQNSERAVATLKNVYKRIKSNELSILLAPEGSRKHPGVIGPFKKGPFHMAMDLDYPIVPIYFEGNRELSSGGSLMVRAGKAVGHVHQQIDTSGWTAENIDRHIAEVRQLYLNWAGVEDDDIV